MSQEIILGLGILAVALAVGMMAYFLINNRKAQQKRALSIISGQSAAGNTESVKDASDRRRADLAKKLKQTGDPAKEKKKGGLRERLNQAGLDTLPVKKFWVYSAVFGLLMTMLCLIAGQAKIIVVLVAITSFLGIPRLFIKIKIARRQKKFLEEFSDALEGIVRLLKAGMPVGEAITMVAREFTGPVGEEMAKIYDEQKIGVPLSEACQKAAERMPITEMQMFATGITIQQQTGSSLSEILTNLARVIRARFRLKRKVQALSSEAKASAMIIGALPIVVAGGLYLINPAYMEPLFFTFKGKCYLAGAATWMSMGILVMRQMINFKV
jgi:tight adherence protein B